MFEIRGFVYYATECIMWFMIYIMSFFIVYPTFSQHWIGTDSTSWRLISVESMLVQPCVPARYIYISSKRHSYAYPAQNWIGVIIQYGLFFTYCRNLEVVQMLYKALYIHGAHDVVSALTRRWFNVMTLNQRWFNDVSMSCARRWIIAHCIMRTQVYFDVIVYELSRLYTLRQIIWSFTPSPLYLFCWYVSYNLCFDTHHCHCTVHYAIVHLLCCFLLGFTAFWAC